MTKNYTKQTFRIFLRHAGRYRWLGFGMAMAVIIASVLNVIVPIFYKKFFDLLSSGLAAAEKVPLLTGILLKILAVYLAAWLFWRLSTFAVSYFENKIMVDLHNTCFAYLHQHAVSFFNNTFVGSLVKKVNRFTRAFEGISDIFIFEFLSVFTDIIFVTIVLTSRHATYGLIVGGWVAFYIIVNYGFSVYKLKYDILKSQSDSRVTAILADTITNQQNIKLFNGYEREIGLFRRASTELKKIRQFCWNLNSVFEAVQSFLMIFLEIGIFYFAVQLWRRGLATIGDFVLIQAYLLTIFHRLWNFGRIIRHYYEHLADANEMTEILETPHEIHDVKMAAELKVDSGAVEFKEVIFSYSQTRRVINNLSLIVRPKEKVALVGPSGGGKTTLINLLLRNYDLEKGKILIDNQKISRMTLDSLRQNIALVPQDPILFHRTLMENILYGRPTATEPEAVLAAKKANAHQFIVNFPDGYGTYVGERGVKLSGGERQRIAIARAILKNAPILVMDEATSSLDSESEKLIQDALAILMKDKTVLVIAHRLSTIMKMDRIVVLDKGRLVEEGSHQDLLKRKNGLYKRLWERQSGGFYPAPLF